MQGISFERPPSNECPDFALQLCQMKGKSTNGITANFFLKKKATAILNNPDGIRIKCICSTKTFYLAHNTLQY
jgi:hypothetical protein